MVIKELVLNTNSLASTESFYTRILGLTVLYRSETNISFSVGHTTLTFSYSKDTSPFYHFAFSIPSNKVDEAHSYIAARTNILLFTPDTTIADFSNWNAHAFYFHDNQKNIIEFIAHHDLPNSSDEIFTSSSIIGICEIGIPVENVTEVCKRFNERFNIAYFSKGLRLKDFSVMGDEYGLFIVTKIGRGWLPTQVPAEKYFCKVGFENKGVYLNYILK